MNTQTDGLVFRLAQEADRERIVALCREVFEETRSIRSRTAFDEEWWAWQNWKPHSSPSLVAIAQDGDEICGVFALPVRAFAIVLRVIASCGGETGAGGVIGEQGVPS